MVVASLTREGCEEMRLGFFRKYARSGLISVAVIGKFPSFIKVEAVPGTKLPSEYRGLPVYIHFTEDRIVNAI